MDKTMELILVAMVLMVSAVIIIAMANNQIGGFGETIDGQREDVNDDLEDELDNVDYSDDLSADFEREFYVSGNDDKEVQSSVMV